MTAAEFLTYPPDLGPRDAIVGISSSGEFKDVVAVAEAVRGRVPMAGVVHVRDSTLTGLVPELMVSAGGPSTVPVMTKTFSATLVATELLLLELLGPARATRERDRILAAADAADAAIAAAEPLVEPVAATLARRPPPVRDRRRASRIRPPSRPRSSSRRWRSSTPRAPRSGR